MKVSLTQFMVLATTFVGFSDARVSGKKHKSKGKKSPKMKPATPAPAPVVPPTPVQVVPPTPLPTTSEPTAALDAFPDSFPLRSALMEDSLVAHLQALEDIA